MHPLVSLYLSGMLCSVLNSIAHAFAGKALGATVEEVSLLCGYNIARFRLGGILWQLKLPYFGGFVKFREKEGDEFGGSFSDLHPLNRALIMASGPLVVLTVALVCLGPTRGALSFWHGFPQLIQGMLSPIEIGTKLVRSLFRLIRASPFTTALGIVAAKQAAANLLPLPPLMGGQILMTLAQWRSHLPERILIGVNYVGIITDLILLGCWLYATARVLMFG